MATRPPPGYPAGPAHKREAAETSRDAEFDLPPQFDPNAPEFKMPGRSFSAEAPVFMPRNDAGMRAEAAEFIPMVGGWAAVQAEAFHPTKKRQMPFASDEEWETRIAKREKEVETIKSLLSYRLYVEVFPHDNRGDDDPKTPDPRDRSVSKRMWKWNVEKWRLQLKGRCVYSRSVMIQCRESLLRLEEEEEEEEEAERGSAGGSMPKRGKKHSGEKSVEAVREKLAKLPTPSHSGPREGAAEPLEVSVEGEWSIGGRLRTARLPSTELPEPPGIAAPPGFVPKVDGAPAGTSPVGASGPLSAIGPGTFQ